MTKSDDNQTDATDRLNSAGRSCSHTQSFDVNRRDRKSDSADIDRTQTREIGGSNSSDAKRGDLVGSFKLTECLGEGGMGTVWKAVQEEPVHRTVAVKLIKSGVANEDMMSRFNTERQILALLNHPHIAKFLDAGMTSEGPFFAMELVSGESLTRYCEARQMTIDGRLRLFCKICSGVHHAHQKGILHRDLKPGNIVVAEVDGKPNPKVIDFGLAKVLTADTRLSKGALNTQVGQILGTLKYMSPEQASLDQADVDTGTDVYALGVILYELLVGVTPLDTMGCNDLSLFGILEQIRKSEAFRPSRYVASLSSVERSGLAASRKTTSGQFHRLLEGDLDWIVAKALNKERSLRYESTASLAKDVGRFLSGKPIEARPPSSTYRIKKFANRNKVLVAASVLVFLSLLGGIVGTSFGMVRANLAWVAEAKRAESERLAKEESQLRLKHIENGNMVLTGIFDELDVRKVDDSNEPLESILAERLVLAGDQLNEIGAVPVSIASMKHKLGNSLLNLGYPEKATQLFDDALQKRRDNLGQFDPRTIESLNGLCESLQATGKHHRAIELYSKLFHANFSSAENLDLVLLTCRNNLAEAYRESGDPESAIPIFREVMELRKQKLGTNHIDTMTTENNLALSLQAIEETAEARTILESLSRKAEAKLGKGHPDTSVFKNNLAGVYRDLGEFEKSINQLEDVSSNIQSELGMNHPLTLKSLNNVADSYVASRNFDQAISIYEDLLERANKKLGERHSDTLAITANYARCCYVAKKTSLAIELYKKSTEGMRQQDSTHPFFPDCLQGLATCHWSQGEVQKAIPLFKEALTLLEADSQMDQTSILAAKANLGLVYRDAENYEEAVTLLETVCEKIPENPSLKYVRDELRIAYRRGGMRSKFVTMLNADYVKAEESTNPGTPERANAFVRLGSDFSHAENWEQAQVLLGESWRIRNGLIPDDWRTFNTQSLYGYALFQNQKLGNATIHETGKKSRFESAFNALNNGFLGAFERRESIPKVVRRKYLLDAVDRLIEYCEYVNETDLVEFWSERKKKISRVDN